MDEMHANTNLYNVIANDDLQDDDIPLNNILGLYVLVNFDGKMARCLIDTVASISWLDKHDLEIPYK